MLTIITKSVALKKTVFKTNFTYSYFSVAVFCLVQKKEWEKMSNNIIGSKDNISSNYKMLITAHKKLKNLVSRRRRKKCAVTFEPFFMPIIMRLI